MSFDIDKCIIKKVWCGNADQIPSSRKKHYKKVGSRYECLKQGFGAGSHIERSNNLPKNSLQHISYIGPKMESNFKANNIQTISQLKTDMKNKSALTKDNFLKKILVNSDGTLNKKAYNSVISYLYQNGILNLPSCKTI